MNRSVAYDELCKEIWDFYENQKDRLRDAFANAGGSKGGCQIASPWLPPPLERCDSEVKLLFVGLSPKQLQGYRYATSLSEAKKNFRDSLWTTFIPKFLGIEDCNVHLSGFITGKSN